MTETTVLIVTQVYETRVFEVPAFRQGALALHKTFVGRTLAGEPALSVLDDWTITHVPTGRAVIKGVPYIVGERLLQELASIEDWESLSYPLPEDKEEELWRRIKKIVKSVMLEAGLEAVWQGLCYIWGC